MTRLKKSSYQAVWRTVWQAASTPAWSPAWQSASTSAWNPACFHGSLEVMRVGMTEREAAAIGGDVYVSKVHFASNVMAQAAGNPYGFVKVVWRNDVMVGIAAIGANVSQLTLSAQLLLIGQYQGSKLNSFMVAHPTLDETLVAAIRAQRKPSKD